MSEEVSEETYGLGSLVARKPTKKKPIVINNLALWLTPKEVKPPVDENWVMQWKS